MACLGLAQVATGQVLIDAIAIPGLRSTGGVGVSFRYGLIRMSGTATSPIEFGALLTIIFPLAVHNALYPVGRSRLMRWFPVVVTSLALALSLSRSAYIGLAVALVVLFIGWPNRLRWRALAWAVAASAVIAVAAPQVFRAVRSMFVTAADDPSITSRTDSYAVVWQFFVDSPWFGRGLGTFLPKYRILDNNYLGLLVNIGAVGLLAFVGILAVTLVLLAKQRRRMSDEKDRNLALALFAGICAGAASFAFFDAFAFPMTTGTLFLMVGLSGSLGRLQSEDEQGLAPALTSGLKHS
jgi:O-antigen ligase